MSLATRASWVLIFTCACWAFSFPTMKALEQVGRREVPDAPTVFFAALCVATRFSVGAAALALLRGSRLGWPTRREVEQGAGLGLFGGLGLVLQMDGMAYTLASTSAFLTQGYCVLIPLWLALRHRRFPGWSVVGACLLALSGAGVLAGVSGDGLRLGRGEWETLAGSVLFAGQILWLERPRFRGNDTWRATTVMFAVMAAVTIPLALALAPRASDLPRAFSSPAALGLLAVLIGVCTLVTFPLANHWQPRLPATQAGLLYCTEPVFTSIVTLFAPGWISRATGIAYPDETLTWNLLTGGSLILGANIWLQLHPPAIPPGAAAP